jgi:NADH dehydrogenase
MSGFVAWLVWVFLHLMSLPQLQNRFRVQNQWLWFYFTGQRSAELIPELPKPAPMNPAIERSLASCIQPPDVTGQRE